jgi:hypothetical protein
MYALANKKDSTRANFGADSRRPRRVDFCGVGRIRGLGIIARGLSASEKVGSIEIKNEVRTGSGSDRIKGSQRGDRADKDYLIEAVAKALKVFEALEGRNFEPVSVARVAQRTGFGRDFCFRALKTLKLAGYAKETLDGWILGPKAEALSRKLSASLLSR